MHHKYGRTQQDNIHSIRNLVALCSICHFAFDNGEWTFLPKDMAAWVRAAQDEPRRDLILEYNAQQDIECRRWRLEHDPESRASQDNYYVSAFTNQPIKMWRGEAGLLILRNAAILSTPDYARDTELVATLDTYRKLLEIWVKFVKKCSKKCRMCRENKGEADEPEEPEEPNEPDEGSKGNKEDEPEEPDEESEEEDARDKPTQKAFPLGPYSATRSNVLITQLKENKDHTH